VNGYLIISVKVLLDFVTSSQDVPEAETNGGS
jgi:hypothetical protein